jgi:hypothetical protein
MIHPKTTAGFFMAAIIYLSISFICWEIDPNQWHWSARLVFILLQAGNAYDPDKKTEE